MLGLPDQAGEHVLGVRDGVDLRPDPAGPPWRIRVRRASASGRGDGFRFGFVGDHDLVAAALRRQHQRRVGGALRRGRP
jgi:hypothetical protein